jgi:hypothetical protein
MHPLSAMEERGRSFLHGELAGKSPSILPHPDVKSVLLATMKNFQKSKRI